MLCSHCENDVKYVLPIIKQLYDTEGFETGTTNEYICIGCLQNLDSDDTVGIPKTK